MKKHMTDFITQLKIRGLSQDTIEKYTENLSYFFFFYKNHSIQTMTMEEIFSYIIYLKEVKQQASSYINQQTASVKFFFRYVIKKDWNFDHIPYLKEHRKLPVVLSKQEIARLFDATQNVKHLALLSTMYGTGMRPKELCLLKIEDIKPDQGVILIKNGKGGKQRLVMLSSELQKILVRYETEWLEDRSHFLFPGEDSSHPITVDTVSAVFRYCKKKANIIGNSSLYSLRHAFATHLLEAGTNLRVIQTLLGHASCESTILYLQVASETVSKTVSPLDSIFV
jgi:site-specific recombinase XerD